MPFNERPLPAPQRFSNRAIGTSVELLIPAWPDWAAGSSDAAQGTQGRWQDQASTEAAPDQGKRLTAESRSENVAPCASVDSTRITPPWRRAIAWAMASPNPVPPC